MKTLARTLSRGDLKAEIADERELSDCSSSVTDEEIRVIRELLDEDI